MRRALCSLLLLCTAPAFASSLEPSPADIARAAQSCTAEGAFGIRFGAADLSKGAAIGPFAVEQISTKPPHGVFRIATLASFAKAQMSEEDRMAVATWVLRKLDAEIAANRRFAARQPRPDGVTYFSANDRRTGYALDISHSGVAVRMICTDLSLAPQAQP